MNGYMRVITPNGNETTASVNVPPSLSVLQEIVGGYIEKVPLWDSVLGDEAQQCVVYCNEDGKLAGLPINERATAEWKRVAVRDKRIEHIDQLRDHLVGSIVILYGDEEFMSEL